MAVTTKDDGDELFNSFSEINQAVPAPVCCPEETRPNGALWVKSVFVRTGFYDDGEEAAAAGAAAAGGAAV